MSSTNHRRLTIPVEILNREFDAKLLLACFAAERGFAVTIGSKHEIQLGLDVLPRSIYVGPNLTGRMVDFYELLTSMGHTVVCSDEEAVVYYNREAYFEAKMDPRAFRQVSRLFAWGDNSAQLWRSHDDYSETPIHVTGHPRLDMLRPELRSFWLQDVQALRERFSRFVLINTNFGKINNYRPGKGLQLNTLNAAEADPSSVSEFDLGLARHRYALFDAFQEMVGALARRYPELAIVVRPHQSEDHQTWQRAAGGCSNVQVVHEGNVVPWLLAAEATIHNGCTTAVEGYLLGKPAIAYQPLTSECFDLHLPNNLSHQAFELGELASMVGEMVNGGLRGASDAEDNRQRLAEEYVIPMQGPLASQRIAEILDQSADGSSTSFNTLSSAYLTAKAKATTRRLTRRFNALLGARRPANKLRRTEYHGHIFPDLGIEHVKSRIADFRELTDRFHDLDAKTISNKIFEVSSR